LEHEKSSLIIIEEQIKQVKSELNERRKNIAELVPSQLQDKMTKITIKSQKSTVNNEQLRLNQTKA
jgi:hypothetical protein